MKKICTLALFFLSFCAFSQSITVSGTIKDVLTSMPVESVSIGILGSNSGTISNEEGKFRITLPSKNSTITFSHIYYKLENYLPKDNETEIVVYLEPKSFVLDEVVINQKPGKELLGDAVAASKKKLEKSLLLNTYYREFINVDGKYTSFADGLVDYYVKRKSGAADLEVKQSRVIDMKDENATEREKAIQSANVNDMQDAIENAYNFKGVTELLKSEKYYFNVETKTEAGGNSIEIITVEPKEGLEDEMLYAGTVTFDSKTKLILDIDLGFSEDHKKFNVLHNILIAKIKFNNFERKSSFKIDGDKYIMVYSRIKANIFIKMGKKINNTFEGTCDVTTLNYKEGEYKIDSDKKYKQRSLFKNGNKYTEEFWKKYDIRLLNDAEQRVINSLK